MKTLEVGLLLPESGADVLPHLLVQLRPWDVIYKQRRLWKIVRRMQSSGDLGPERSHAVSSPGTPLAPMCPWRALETAASDTNRDAALQLCSFLGLL